LLPSVVIIYVLLLGPVGEYCVAIGLSVCLSVCPRAYLWNRWTDLDEVFAQILRGRGSVFLWQRCDTLCTSGFMDDVTFARRLNGPYGESTVKRLPRKALQYRDGVWCLWMPCSILYL